MILSCRVGTRTLFDVPARQATKAGGITSLELIPGLLKFLQTRALGVAKRMKDKYTCRLCFPFSISCSQTQPF